MPASIPNRVSTQIRINRIIYEKIIFIAKNENRYINNQIEYFLKKGIDAYEKEYGPISLPEDE